MPLDAVGIVEAVAQVDGKKLLSKSVDAQLAAARAAVKKLPSAAVKQSSGGNDAYMEGSDEGYGRGEDEEMDERQEMARAHSIR